MNCWWMAPWRMSGRWQVILIMSAVCFSSSLATFWPCAICNTTPRAGTNANESHESVPSAQQYTEQIADERQRPALCDRSYCDMPRAEPTKFTSQFRRVTQQDPRQPHGRRRTRSGRPAPSNEGLSLLFFSLRGRQQPARARKYNIHIRTNTAAPVIVKWWYIPSTGAENISVPAAENERS